MSAARPHGANRRARWQCRRVLALAVALALVGSGAEMWLAPGTLPGVGPATARAASPDQRLGLEGFWSLATPAPVAGGWTLGVNTDTGNGVLGIAPVALPGKGPLLGEALIYNSGDSADTGLGAGWLLARSETLTAQPDGSMVWRDDDGTRHRFTRNVDGSYASPVGVRVTLRAEAGGAYTLTYPDQVVTRFEGGRLVAAQDENGNKLTLAWDAGGRLTGQTDASGRSLAYGYDAAGKLVSLKDPAARTWTFAYDAGRLASVTDPTGALSRLGYGPDGRLASVTDPKGAVTSIGYDSGGRVAAVTDGRSTATQQLVTKFAYDTVTATTTITGPGGGISSVRHNAAGNPVEHVDEAGVKTTTAWSGNQPTEDTDAAGSTSYTRDAAGNVTAVTDTVTATSSATEKAAYDSRNNLVSVTDASGVREDVRVDARSNPLSEVLPARREASANSFNAAGNLSSETVIGAATYNQLLNGSFEQVDSVTGKAAGWYYGGAFSVDGASARYGAKSLKFTSATAVTAAADTDLITTVPGAELTLSAELRMNQLEGGGGVWLRLTYYDAANVQIGVAESGAAVGSGNAPLIATSTAPAGAAKVAASVQVSQATGDFWLDGVQLEAALNPADGPTRSRFDYVPNSSFEYGTNGWAGVGTAVIDNVAAFGGDFSLKVSAPATGSAHGNSGLLGVSGGERLTLSGLLRPESLTGTGARVQVQFYDAAGTYLAGAASRDLAGTLNWARSGVAVTAPATAATARVFAIVEAGTGAARFDNVKLMPASTFRAGYDPAGNNRTSTTDPLGNQTTAGYDAVGNLTSVTDPSGAATRVEYDAANRPVRLTDATGKVTHFEYDAAGNGTAVRDARSLDGADNTYKTTFGYNALGQRTSRTDPLGRTTTYTVDSAGRATRTTNPSGSTVDKGYDSAGRITSRAASDNPLSHTATYDPAGNLASVTDSAGRKSTYSYDKANQLTGSTDSWGLATTLARDLEGRLTAVSHPDGTKVSYSYDSAGQPLGITDPTGRTIRTSYDDAGRPFKISRFNVGHGNTHLDYDSAGRLHTLISFRDFHRYAYDSRGLITGIDTSTGPQRFEYDAPGRLTAYTDQAGKRTTYSYDPAGNLTSKDGTTYTHDAAGQITNPGFTYSAHGGLTSDGVRNYTWDADHRLTKITKVDGTPVAEYTYDHRGLRTSKSTPMGTTRYHYNAEGQLVRESAPTGATTARYTYDPDGDLVHLEWKGTHYYPATNHRGDVIALYDNQANRVATYTYGPYGEMLGSTGTVDQPWRYAGYHYDTETGLYYNQQRYYSPTLGRFLSPDPLDTFADITAMGAAYSTYAYVAGNPISLIDDDGERPKKKKVRKHCRSKKHKKHKHCKKKRIASASFGRSSGRFSNAFFGTGAPCRGQVTSVYNFATGELYSDIEVTAPFGIFYYSGTAAATGPNGTSSQRFQGFSFGGPSVRTRVNHGTFTLPLIGVNVAFYARGAVGGLFPSYASCEAGAGLGGWTA